MYFIYFIHIRIYIHTKIQCYSPFLSPREKLSNPLYDLLKAKDYSQNSFFKSLHATVPWAPWSRTTAHSGMMYSIWVSLLVSPKECIILSNFVFLNATPEPETKLCKTDPSLWAIHPRLLKHAQASEIAEPQKTSGPLMAFQFGYPKSLVTAGNLGLQYLSSEYKSIKQKATGLAQRVTEEARIQTISLMW